MSTSLPGGVGLLPVAVRLSRVGRAQPPDDQATRQFIMPGTCNCNGYKKAGRETADTA